METKNRKPWDEIRISRAKVMSVWNNGKNQVNVGFLLEDLEEMKALLEEGVAFFGANIEHQRKLQ